MSDPNDSKEPIADPDPEDSTAPAATGNETGGGADAPGAGGAPGATPGGTEAEAPPPPPPPSSGPAGSPRKADIGKRLVAFIIDAVIAGIIGVAIPAIGGLIGSAYMLLRDGLEFDFMNHRSIGKHVMKLHIVALEGQPLDITMSVKRNWMFAIGALVPLLLFIPILGWIAIPFVSLAALVLGVVELVLVLTDGEGRRIGDKMAETRVAED